MAYAALSLLLLVVGERIPTAALRGVGAFVFEPFDRITLAGDRALLAWRENEELHRRLTMLELQNRQLRGEQYENQRLRLQLGLPEWRGLTVRPVEILALSGDPTPTSATLSAGARQGVNVGDAVEAGQTLGVIADWPNEGDHLHLDAALDPVGREWVTPDIRWIDPAEILKAHIDPALVDAMLRVGD